LKIAWLSYLDAHAFDGGGELQQRAVIDAGRARGHAIVQAAFLRGRAQRALRRTQLHRQVRVEWDADAFVVADIRNAPALRERFPPAVVKRALGTGRAFVLQTAWVDVCPFDVPCEGDPTRCVAGCDRAWARELYEQARGAIFLSPLHRRTVAGVMGGPLPEVQILMRPMVDVDRFHPRAEPRDIDVLYVGRINEAKGYSALVERFGADRLTFVGRNLLGRPIEGTYLGFISREELPAVYNRARTFAHLPAWVEPMGLGVSEAALCGCEIVTNDRVGVTTYPDEDWRDPSVVRGNPDRFWDEFEAACA
jgi:glycosyltransferase involved in cell wall biosynthesis